ncbi:MAG: DUF4239 domain-containing protein [Devosia sp.]
MNYFTIMPFWLSGAILVILPTLVAMSAPFLIRRAVTLQGLQANNEVAGFKFAVVGVLYAVLLAFAVIVVWERFSDSESQVAQEAGASATIYRLADSVGGTSSGALKQSLSKYLQVAIDKDWPAMGQGHGSPEATKALDDLYSAALEVMPADARSKVVLSEMLHQLDLLTQARRARLVASPGVVPGVLWMVLLGGAFLTVGFTFFFGTQNLRAQSMMTGIVTVLIFSGLLVIVSIDHPFAGSVQVTPEGLKAVLEDFGK